MKKKPPPKRPPRKPPRTGPREKINLELKELIVQHLNEGGIVGTAAKKFGVSRRGIYAAMERDNIFRHRVNDARDITDDQVVSYLYEAAKGGNVTAMIFWLKNRRSNEWRDQHDYNIGATENAQRLEFVVKVGSGEPLPWPGSVAASGGVSS